MNTNRPFNPTILAGKFGTSSSTPAAITPHTSGSGAFQWSSGP